MCDCSVDLIDLKAKLRLMEQHYHEDMNELFAELKRLSQALEQVRAPTKPKPDNEEKVSWLYFDQELA